MDLKEMGNEPTITGMNQLDTAVILEKYNLILGMINFGTPEQKRQAGIQLKQLEPLIQAHISIEAFELANRNLGLSEEEIEALERVGK